MLTRSKVPQLHEDRLETVTLGAPRRRPPLARWLTDEHTITGRWPRAMGLSWVVVFAAAIAVEPAPATPDAPEPVWASILFLGLLAALGAVGVGLARRQRLGLVASVAAGGMALIATVMCPVSGHHGTIGAWWYLQLVGFTGLVGASLVGLRRSRTPQDRTSTTA